MSNTEQNVLEKLKRKRTTLKSSTTKLLNKINDLAKDENPDLTVLEDAHAQLLSKEMQILELDKEIEDKIDDLDQLEVEVESNQDYRDRMITAKSKINRCLKNLSKIEVRSKTPENTNSAENSKINSDSKIQVKLPKLVIEKFNGDPENWQEFWSQYETTIHDNVNLSKTEKFSYLKSFLKGSAFIAIQGLLISDKNYDTAIEILKGRYGRKDILVRSHINKLLNLSPVRSTMQLKELRELYDTCEIQIRSLESLDIELKSYGNLLFPIVTKLIPEGLILEYNRKFSKDAESWDISKLLEFIRFEIENREKTFSFRKECTGQFRNKIPYKNVEDHEFHPRKEAFDRRNKIKPENVSSAAALNTSIDNQCLFCLENHNLELCTKTLSEKKEILKREGRCYLCLKKFHLISSCTSRIRCRICHKRHNTAICNKSEKGETPETPIEAVVSSVHHEGSVKEIYLQTARVNACGKQNKRPVRILLDLGSERSFIVNRVAKQLCLERVGEEEVKVHSFESHNPVSERRNRYSVILRNRRSPRKGLRIEVLETEKISEALIGVPQREIQDYFRKNKLQLADGNFEEPSDSELCVLIGSDYYWRIVTGKVRRLSDSLVSSETLFGWVVNGTTISSNISTKQPSVQVMKTALGIPNINNDHETDKVIRKFWDLEAIGIRNEIENEELGNEILEEFNKTIKFNGDRYEVKLPWNNRAEELQDNYDIALERLKSLVRRFKKSPEFYEGYKTVIENYIDKGMAEEVNESSDTKKYYMPHQAVIRKDKTTKLRVVYDASSHRADVASLNECLHSGPNLNPSLLKTLIQFREHKIAFTADIEQAFLQISLSPDDRDAVRFLWINEPLNENGELNVRVLRMTRVIFGATSSPFLLAASIQYHIDKYKETNKKAYDLLNECLYVDDLIAGDEDENGAVVVFEDVKKILKEAGFNMRKWKTNCSSLQKVFDEHEENKFESSKEQKVLGYKWNYEEDSLKIEIQGLLDQVKTMKKNVTKREVLKVIGRIYDPVGFLSPFVVTAKILMQDVWQIGIDWDEPLPWELQHRWKSWCNQLHEIADLRIPRHYFEGNVKTELQNVQMHCFTDASKSAYGAVIYFRYVTADGEIKSNIIISKTRVSPLKKLSLPRLELMAAVIGARLALNVKQQLAKEIVMKQYFWTDSSATLHWIQGDSKRWKPFVENRVIEIQEKTSPDEWHYCPGEENPADMLTRGENVEFIKKSEMWWCGPEWLVRDERFWPELKTRASKEEVDPEKRKIIKEMFQASCIVSTDEPIFDLKHYSSLRKVIRVTAWILRFAKNIKPGSNKQSGVLNTEELKNAEKYWTKKTQEEFFLDELIALSQNKVIAANSKLILLKPFLDEDKILRVGGRLQNAGLTYSETHPIILPSSSYFSDLQIEEAHKRIGHGGIAETLTQVRENLWIIKGRQRVKGLINKCLTCRRFRAKPFCQDMAPLPPNRIREALPFEVSGIDFAGPLYTRTREKVYIALFTCAVTRAVHLELITDLTTPKFLLAFRRFISRRGISKYIYSDNAKTFQRADKDIQKLWQLIKDPETLEYFGKNGIKWIYIVERAAWWGGFWERLVRSVKTCLKKILGRAALGYEELETILTETEAILNSRPLTYIYSEVQEPEPLCPGHFLVGKRLTSLPPEKIKYQKISKKGYVKRYRYRLALIENLWKTWKRHYLMELRSAHCSKQAKSTEIKENTVVLIYDEKQPRLLWKLGIISEVHHGRDGRVRACTLRLANGTCLKRSVQHLYPLELDSNNGTSDANFPGPEDFADFPPTNVEMD